MKTNKLGMLGVALTLFSNLSFSTSCPQVGNYTLTSHDQNNQHCTYTSSGVGSIGIRGTRAVHNCPRFILTDPNFRQVGTCHVVMRRAQPVINQPGRNNNPRTACTCSVSAIR